MGVRSFALWYIEKENIEQNTPVEAEVHINLWNNSKIGKEKLSYVDLGIFINNIENIDTIKFFIPAKKEEIEIYDLIERISKSKEQLLNAIFNEDYSSVHGVQAKKTLVECPQDTENKKRENFYLYELDNSNQIKKDELDGGTIVKIDIKGIKVENNNKSHYFRIRCKIKGEVEFIKDQVNDVSFFNSFFTKVEIIDFRLNDIRSCKKNIKEKYENQKNFNITKVHYLVLRNAQDEVIYFGQIGSRILEVDLWKEYFKEDFNKNQDVIAYHIKQTSGKSFTNLIRFKYENTNKERLVYSALIVIGLGIISAIIYDFLKISLTSLISFFKSILSS